MRICIAYDCLYPHTVGGAERWYRALAERLAADGHEIDFLTLRQWPEGEDAAVPGVNVVAVGPKMALYVGGRRRVWPPMRFGLGVLLHLLRSRRRYDVVHMASFPYFSLLAAGLVAPLGGYRLVIDWHEVWTAQYWHEYLGRVGGSVGLTVQRLGMLIPQQAVCFSELHARRLRAYGLRGPITVLRGQFAGREPVRQVAAEPPVVVFAGRHIPEKRVTAVVSAIAVARAKVPGLRGAIYGDGPERSAVERAVVLAGLVDEIDVPGFAAAEQVEESIGRALCLVLPSRREGYGLVIVEAAAAGTPSVVVAGSDNAAVELIEEGINGTIAPSASGTDIAAAIVTVFEGGTALRASTAAWFERHRVELSLERSLDAVIELYTGPSSRES